MTSQKIVSLQPALSSAKFPERFIESSVSVLRVVLRADLLRDAHLDRIQEACRDWTRFERVSEAEDPWEVEGLILDADVLVGWAPPGALLDSPVRYYLCGSAGIDAYRHTGLENKPGFLMCNADGTMTIPIAEHALAFMMTAERELFRHAVQQRDRVWKRIPGAGELHGSTVCIVGFGGAGRELAIRCRALGMRVIGVRRSKGADSAADAMFTPERLAEAVSTADHVVACLPGGVETIRIFNREIFAAMKAGASFHAVSRGSVIDFAALEEALISGHLKFAGLDVTDPEPLPPECPLWEMPNVLLTSHSAGWSPRLADRLCDLFVENLQNIRNGRPLRNVVSLH